MNRTRCGNILKQTSILGVVVIHVIIREETPVVNLPPYNVLEKSIAKLHHNELTKRDTTKYTLFV